MNLFIRIGLLISFLSILSTGVWGQLSIDVLAKHVSCPKNQDAELTITVVGGGGKNIIIQWENSATGENDYAVVSGSSAKVTFPIDGDKKTPICSGSYSISAVDVSSAPKVQNVTSAIQVFEPQQPGYRVIRSGKEASDGKIEIDTELKKDIYSYEYSLDGGKTYMEELFFENLLPKKYSLKIKITSLLTECVLDEMINLLPAESTDKQ